MKRILQIYSSDLKHIMTNWAALIIILSLIFLPSLYAWFNIKATWDPYGNTKDIPVAVTNLDMGYKVRGNNINVGEMIVKSLKANNKLGWTFVNEKNALNGVKHGKYYASITIPEDFSKRISSILEANPEKPIITYTVNEKVNAIAPKITSTGASGIVQEISRSFIKTVGETTFSIFNQLGIQLEQDLPSIENMKRLIFKLEEDIPKMNQAIDIAQDDVNKAQELVGKARKNIPIVEKVVEDGAEFTKQLSDFLTISDDALRKATPVIKESLILLEQMTYSIASKYQNKTMDQAEIQTINSRLTIGINTLKTIEDVSGIDIPELDKVKSNFLKQIEMNNKALDSIKKGETPPQNQLYALSKDTADTLSNVVSNFDSNLAPRILVAMDNTRNTISNVADTLKKAQNDLPNAEKILLDADRGLVIGEREIQNLKRRLPIAEAKIKETANRIREFEKKEDINEIIDFLKRDARKESDFLKEPVLLKEKKLFPIPNYGSAMSPFFTTLSFWVGAMLLISLLTVEVDDNYRYQTYQIYFGRLLTFISLAFLQTFVITVGDIYFLNTYVTNKVLFILFGLFNGGVFVTMVYTLVSVFGNVGKAMGIVLLVLQISGSGGTFPIQVAPRFFQVINPYLPFTYSISMMREAAGGIVWDTVKKDFFMLCVFLIISLIFGVFCKRKINSISTGLVKKVKESRLIH